MNNETKLKAVAEYRKDIKQLKLVNIALTVIALIAVVAWFTRTVIIQYEIPGLPAGSTIGKNNASLGAKYAVCMAVTANLASVNPSNVEDIKAFIQPFLSPDVFTKISLQIDDQAARLRAQRELGSYNFTFKEARYDPKLDKLFIRGDIHTINAAKDTAQPWVFEYRVHIADYLIKIDDIKNYEGEIMHDTAYYESLKK